MNDNFHKLIQSAKQIELSSEKKGIIRARVESFIELTPITQTVSKPIKSPFTPRISISYFSKAISFALIVLIAGGSTISYASEDTLPGDTLYTVKVNVKEPLEQKLALTPQAKLEVKTKQVEKRLTEAQTLLQKNDTSPEKHKEVEVRVEKQVEEIAQTISELQEKGDVETILSATSKLQPVLKAHQEALQKEVNEPSTELLAKSVNPVEISTFMDSENESSDISRVSLVQETETTETAEVTGESEASDVSELKSSLADSLLKTVEKTLLQVEEQETKALESVDNLEVTEINKELISSVTDKKVEEATKEIEEIKNQISQNETIISESSNVSEPESTLEQTIEAEVIVLETTIKQDELILTLADAEILLAESKNLYEQGLYKESLEKAQEAIKITAMIEANKKIEAAKEIKVETKPDISEPVTIPEKIIPSETQIQIEDQASQAIQSLENSLILKQNKNAQ